MGLHGHMAFGIHLSRDSHENMVKNNNISSNMYGIYGYSCFNNILIENNIINNIYSINFYGSAINNIVYNNNFINNTKVGRAPHSLYSNAWDNGSQGNYWSNYTGTDNNGDGIGDTPYLVYENNQDNHPLMKVYVEESLEPFTPSRTVPEDSDPITRFISFLINDISKGLAPLMLLVTLTIVTIFLVLNHKRKTVEVMK
jgi:parallel beta-helix repeat protein